MSVERVGLSVIAAIAVIVMVVTLAAVWLFVTDPVAVATAVGDGEITPLVRDLADVILEALRGLLEFL